MGLANSGLAQQNEDNSNMFIGCAILKYCSKKTQTGVDLKMIALMEASAMQMNTSCQAYENALKVYEDNLPMIGERLKARGKKTCLTSLQL